METKRTRIRSKLECGQFKILDSPDVLDAACEGLFIYDDPINQDELESFRDQVGHERRQSRKLKAHGYGDYDFYIRWVRKEHFESREQLDRMFGKATFSRAEVRSYKSKKNREVASLEDFCDNPFNITLSVNMDYYTKNKTEIEKDLGREVDLDDEDELKEAERALFRMHMARVFGEEEGDLVQESASGVTFRDVRVLFEDGNGSCGTAERGDKFFMFSFFTS